MTLAEKLRIEELAEKGLSGSEIARLLGNFITKSMVIGYCYRNRIKLQGSTKPRPRPETRQAAPLGPQSRIALAMTNYVRHNPDRPITLPKLKFMGERE